MLGLLSVGLLLISAVGVLAVCFQLVAWRAHQAPGLGFRRVPRTRSFLSSGRGISILKPLCGVDAQLAENIETFATLNFPCFEVLLGVASRFDPAYPIAEQAARRWPRRVRVVLQDGAPGLNPKVNQLITLARHAAYPILAISDSNTRASADYLEAILEGFDDPRVACVSHPVIGTDHRTLGASLDSLHLSTAIGPGMAAAHRVLGKTIAVGKSMALSRAGLAAIGGFTAVKDVLAEDFVISEKLVARGYRVVLARGVIRNVSNHGSVSAFINRYARWSVIHRTAVSLPIYLAELLLNPAPLAWLAVLLHPTAFTVQIAALLTFTKVYVDLVALGEAHPRGVIFRLLLRDAITFGLWFYGLVVRQIVWRGKSLRVDAGSQLSRSPRQPTDWRLTSSPATARLPAQDLPDRDLTATATSWTARITANGTHP